VFGRWLHLATFLRGETQEVAAFAANPDADVPHAAMTVT